MRIVLEILAQTARRLASLWLTLACLVLAAAMLAWSLAGDGVVGWEIAVPFAAMCANLLAALAMTPALRRQAGLLVFHLGLAVLALAAAAGRLTSLDGQIEVAEGLPLDPSLAVVRAGPLHRFALPDGAFVQGPFGIDYLPGMTRTETRSQVTTAGGSRAVVGDDTALVIDGYRLYTSHNKGFAPLLSFRAGGGRWRTTAVHLPPYPMLDYQQGTEWTPAGGGAMTVWLHLPKPIYDQDASWSFRKPDDATLVIDDGRSRHELRPGDRVEAAGGQVRYDELRVWMGYTIHYDPSRPWLLAAAIVAVAGLLWHGLAKIRAVAELAGRGPLGERRRPS